MIYAPIIHNLAPFRLARYSDAITMVVHAADPAIEDGEGCERKWGRTRDGETVWMTCVNYHIHNDAIIVRILDPL